MNDDNLISTRVNWCEQEIIRHTTQIAHIKDTTDRIENNVKEINSCLGEIKKNISDLRVNMYSRPSWATTTIITILTGIVIGTFVYLLG